MSAKPREFIFLVQGEGRGHMTQAISLHRMLINNGHIVSCIFIGVSKNRKIPEYFFKNIDAKIEFFHSPNFISDKKNKSIKLGTSILYNTLYLKRYIHSLKKINAAVLEYKPDAIVNFYDFLGGFYNYFFNPKAKYFVVGHQFLTDRSDYEYIKGRTVEKFLYRMYNKLCSLKAYKKLAISLTPLEPARIKNTLTVPPMLRYDLMNKKPTKGNFLLAYVVNDGYGIEIATWHRENPNVKIHCFWDKSGEPEIKELNENLIFHQLKEDEFLDYMSKCRGFITTAGFESICEALYFEKPVLMVPVGGQYEQACNAIQAEKAGAGIYDDYFNISRFLDHIESFKTDNSSFKNWVRQSEKLIIMALTVY